MLVADWVMKEGWFFEEPVFVVDGGVVDVEMKQGFRTPTDELREGEFLDADEAVSRLAPPDGRRLLGALAARKNGVAVYLEHGHPAPEAVTGLIP